MNQNSKAESSPPIQPLSEVRVTLVTANQPDWSGYLGKVFRIGYYRRQDGLNCVWLVSDDGEYGETVDQEMIRTHFDVTYLSDETDLYGVDRSIIPPRTPPSND